MKLGLYHDISGIEEVEIGARNVAELGFHYIQFGAGRLGGPGKPLQWIELSDASCRRIRHGYAQQGVEIAAVSGYANLTPRNEEERLHNVEWLRGLIRQAPELGATYVVTWSGWRGDRLSQVDPSVETPETWETFLASADAVVSTAQDVGITLAWELYFTHVLNTPDRVLKALDRWGGKNVGIIMDGPNLVPPARLDQLESIVDEQFALLGKHIALVHAKDVRLHNGNIDYPEAGGGVLDYQRYMDRLRSIGYDGYVIIEHTTDETTAKTRDFVRSFL